jgi:hypothetical protein
MTQAPDSPQKVIEYMRYQGAKSFDDLKALIDRTSRQWAQALDGMTEEQAEFQPAGEWSAKQVLGHVITANRGINQQIADMAGVESPHPSERAKAMGEIWPEYEEMSIDGLRSEVSEVFDEIQTLMASLAGNNRLDQQFPHPIFGPLNLKEWFAFHRVHAMDHIQQIDKIRADPAFPVAG